MSDVRYTEVSEEEAGQRLDNYLLRLLKGVPKSHVYRVIRGGEVRVNKKRAQVSLRLEAGDKVRIPPLRQAQEKQVQIGERLTQRLHDSIIYEDQQLLVINKPAGIAVHGGSGLSLGLIEALRKIRTDLPYLELVHRLDKETSGCLLLAKKRSILRAIQALLRERAITKTYWALLAHPWKGKKSVAVDAALEKNILKSGERFVAIHTEGKPSETRFQLIENFNDACLMEARPKTGRTHQIRVHSAYLGHPIAGDQKYGDKTWMPGAAIERKRLYLHAHAIQFTLNEKNYQFQAELDERFVQTLKKLREENISYQDFKRSRQ